MRNYKIVFLHEIKEVNGHSATSNYSYVLVSSEEDVNLSEGECKITKDNGEELMVEKKYLASITPGSIMATMITGSNLVSMEDFKQSTVDFFKKKGVEISLF